MTTLQKTFVAATVVVLAGAVLYEARQAAHLRDQVQTLQQLQVPLAEQIKQLQKEGDKATNTIAWLEQGLAKNEKNNSELFKLRGEITALKNSPNTAQIHPSMANNLIPQAKLPDEEMLGTNILPSVGTIFPLHQVLDTTGSRRLTLLNSVAAVDGEGIGSNFHSLLLEKRIGDNWNILRSIMSDEFGGDEPRRIADIYSFDPNTGIAILKVAPRNGPTGQPIPYSWCEWNIISNELVRVIRVCQRPSEPFIDSEK